MLGVCIGQVLGESGELATEGGTCSVAVGVDDGSDTLELAGGDDRGAGGEPGAENLEKRG